MVWVLELLVLFVLFTLMVLPKVIRNPLSMMHAYPPDIYRRAVQLGLVQESQKRSSRQFFVKRIIAVAVIGAIFGLIVHVVNGADSFLTGAGDTLILWTAANWFDALAVDCLWFCHSKRVVIPGTEGMAGYQDYRFHMIAALKGMLLGIPSAIVAGIVVWLIR